MAAFTVLAIMLSLFGAVYTSLNALRLHWGERIEKYISEAELEYGNLTESVPSTKREGAKKYKEGMVLWVVVWKISYFTPIVAFAFFAIVTACCAWWNWVELRGSLATNADSGIFLVDHARFVIGIFLGLVISSLGVATLSFYCIRGAKKHLSSHCKSAQGDDYKSVE